MRKEVPVESRIKSNTGMAMRWQERCKKDARKMRTAMYNCRHSGALIKTRINPLKYHIVRCCKEEVYRKDTAASLNAPKMLLMRKKDHSRLSYVAT